MSETPPATPAGFVPEARFQRERKARQEAERLLEEKSRELFVKNRELQSLTEELERRVADRTRDLEEALRRAEAANRAKSEFLAAMSHELRTPLNAILGLSEQLLGEIADASHADLVQLIARSGEGLLGIVNDVLDFSQIEAGRLTLSATLVDVGDIVGDALVILSHAFADKRLGLGFDAEAGLPPLLADPMRLRQIVLNLAGNALKFTAAGRVDVRVARRGGAVRVSVTDTGIGIAPERHAEIFHPFTQLDTGTTRKFGGTGLGLSITRRLAEAMGGTVGFESEPGRGSTFWAEFPCPEAQRPRPEPRGGTVLFAGIAAEDRAMLASHAAFLGLTVRDVEPAEVPALASACPDLRLIVADAACGMAAGLFAWPLPVVALARVGDSLALARARGAGARTTLALPLGPSAMLRMLRGERGGGEAGANRAYEPPSVETARRAGLLVLAVEDNPVNQQVLGRLLNHLGFAHELADDGQAALEVLRRGGHGLVLTDLHMPNLDGIGLARTIRSGGAACRPDIPLFALTADAFPETAERCRAAGIQAVLTKPLRQSVLERHLEASLPEALALRRPREAAAPRTLAARASDVLDLSPLLQGGLPEGAIGAVLDTFLDSSTPKLRQLQEQLLQGRFAESATLAHFVKGAAANIGAGKLAALLEEIDRRCRGGDEGVSELAWDIDPLFAELTAAIREAMKV